jgi:tRNA-splicing ligase RtcB
MIATTLFANGKSKVPVKVWTTDIEAQAAEQLLMLSEMPFLFKHVAVMPDVHAGKGSTVGTVIATKGAIIPAAVGVDIGCGMAAVKTPYHVSQLNGKLEQLRSYIERSVPVGFNQHKDDSLVSGPDYKELWDDYDVVAHTIQSDTGENFRGLRDKAAAQLGTLGSGNHFIEITVDETGTVWIMLHSGSRNIGKMIAEQYMKLAVEKCRVWCTSLPHTDLAFLPLSETVGQNYVFAMEWAQQYALANRALMLKLVTKQLAYVVEGRRYFEPIFEVNCHHNYTSHENHFGENVYVTRKGAIRARQGDFGIIPGSMGTRSYIVMGLGEKESFTSASHGAGRRMSRSAARKAFTVEDVKIQTAGVECRKDADIIDEIPGAYKDIDTVMENEKDLVMPLHTLKQLISVKG